MNEITLKGMLPRVFVSESIPFSEVWNADLTFRRGCRYLVEAASGAGKSSMCSFIYGARKDYEGTLCFDGKNVADFSIDKWQHLRRESLAYLPQELSLFPELTAMQNIELKNSLTGCVSKEEIEEWLHELGIDSRRDYPVGKMSVGQQQRVGLIRAICQPFDFILLDEPVSHLDEENNRKAAAMIEGVAARQGAGIISTSVGNPLLLDNALKLRL
ncbi:MAG: ATP-binding cassette domain-containing protein [Muribaculaceae bacterium]|nr:ATP-binding cassette domain-containing protein [Muribaculaceae bacterium]MDE6753716.1 ATP-binding cassette domain-containing protein [Muribaculaceae bacterium]